MRFKLSKYVIFNNLNSTSIDKPIYAYSTRTSRYIKLNFFTANLLLKENFLNIESKLINLLIEMELIVPENEDEEEHILMKNYFLSEESRALSFIVEFDNSKTQEAIFNEIKEVGCSIQEEANKDNLRTVYFLFDFRLSDRRIFLMEEIDRYLLGFNLKKIDFFVSLIIMPGSLALFNLKLSVLKLRDIRYVFVEDNISDMNAFAINVDNVFHKDINFGCSIYYYFFLKSHYSNWSDATISTLQKISGVRFIHPDFSYIERPNKDDFDSAFMTFLRNNRIAFNVFPVLQAKIFNGIPEDINVTSQITDFTGGIEEWKHYLQSSKKVRTFYSDVTIKELRKSKCCKCIYLPVCGGYVNVEEPDCPHSIFSIKDRLLLFFENQVI